MINLFAQNLYDQILSAKLSVYKHEGSRKEKSFIATWTCVNKSTWKNNSFFDATRIKHRNLFPADENQIKMEVWNFKSWRTIKWLAKIGVPRCEKGSHFTVFFLFLVRLNRKTDCLEGISTCCNFRWCFYGAFAFFFFK